MVVLEAPAAVHLRVTEMHRQGMRVGLVPTMGALHAGHRSLLDAARRDCDFVVATIFVNPTQFAPEEDLKQYPRPLKDDLDICRAAGVDLVFHPDVDAMYADGHSTFVEVEGLSAEWEGRHRPAHFRGVTTVVMKLFQIAPADVAYFGQKDYQQQLLIRRMCADLNVPIEIHTCPTIREPDGLALSSRNRYLSAEERKSALVLFRALTIAKERTAAGETDIAAVRKEMQACLTQTDGVDFDYATIADADTLEELSDARLRMVALVAARVGTTRLIDNLPLWDEAE